MCRTLIGNMGALCKWVHYDNKSASIKSEPFCGHFIVDTGYNDDGLWMVVAVLHFTSARER